MVKDGYIAKIKDTSTGEEMIDYIVGPRGKVEVGAEGVADLAKKVWGEDGLEDLNSRLERTFALSRREEPQQTQTRIRGREKRRRNEDQQDNEDEDDEEIDESQQ
jgi:melanoma-associated antigen